MKITIKKNYKTYSKESTKKHFKHFFHPWDSCMWMVLDFYSTPSQNWEPHELDEETKIPRGIHA